MSNLRKLVGFPVDSMYSFRISGRPYRVKQSGVATLELLGKIFRGIPANPDWYWLLRFRSEIQSVQRLDETAVLSRVVDRTTHRDVRILAIWLRGRCGGHIGTEILAKFATCADDTTRKEVVRALIRMNAWSRLSEIAEQEINARIRRLATIRAPAEFEKRLTNFARHVTRSSFERRTQGFYVSPGLDYTEYKPPKSVLLIRTILERIRSLVHGWRRAP